MAFRERFVTDYWNPLQSEAEISRIAATHPDLCRLETLPHLSHGYQGAKVEARGRHPVNVLHITAPPNSDAVKPAVLLMRSHYAREWINRWLWWRQPGSWLKTIAAMIPTLGFKRSCAAELASRGFDISWRHGRGRFAVVAISSDLTTLLALGLPTSRCPRPVDGTTPS